MTILTLCFYIAIVASILTFVMLKWSNNVQSVWISFLQNFCGSLFIFSGWVKAVDPMGTAFKMVEYFEEFENTAKSSFLKFTADIFPFMAKYAVEFSVFMIILEIVIGVMLIIGYKPKWASILFFLIMIFFTVLTGFTFLTGYVPKEANFFEFGKWAAFAESNMRVTNCGCFGDFLKLTPETSFKKDLLLMIPAIIFMFSWKKFHSLFTSSLRLGITSFATVALFLFCLANYKWNEPMFDFRPFKKGADIRSLKEAEAKAMGDVKIEFWRLKNKSSSETKIVSDNDYMSNIKAYKADWEVVEQIKSKPSIPNTKISDFALYNLEGSDVTEEVLAEPRSRIMINIPKLYYTSQTFATAIQDTVWKLDTVKATDGKEFTTMKSISEIKEKKEKKNSYTWDEKYKNLLTSKILPFLDSIHQDSIKAFFVVGGVSEDALKALFSQINVTYPIYTADDVLLKTIMRSNPGILLWRNGKIISKWHHNHIPTLDEMRRDFLDWKAPLIH